jgi:hypothetical protein
MATKLKNYDAKAIREAIKEHKKQENMDIVKILVDAVIASGKKFNEIPKESIFSYLNKAGISKSKWDSIYNTLSMQFNETKTTVKVVEDKSFKPEVRNTSTGDIKQRQPRKSIFSEIKKITP